MSEKRIAPPAARVFSDRVVRVPPTVQAFDTNETRPVIGKTRADFRQEEFIRAILQHGKYVTWRKSILCVCFDEVTGQATLGCEECDGSGYVYVDALDIQAHMVSFDKGTRLFEKFGMWQEGGVAVTVEPKYRLGYRDSLEMKDALMSFNELLKKGNRRGIRAKLPSGVDSARYRIAHMTRLAVRENGATVFLDDGQDFRIDANGWIEWTAIGNARVPDGTVLSALYDFHPVFVIVSWPHASRDDTSGRKAKLKNQVISLPIQAMAKLDFIVDVNRPAPTTG